MEKLEEFLGPASGKIVKIARQKRHMQKFLEDLDAVLVDASEDASEGNFKHFYANITTFLCI